MTLEDSIKPPQIKKANVFTLAFLFWLIIKQYITLFQAQNL